VVAACTGGTTARVPGSIQPMACAVSVSGLSAFEVIVRHACRASVPPGVGNVA
jgi:hypothetical protein